MRNSGIDWIGEIPKKWEVVPFRSYAEMRREKNKGEKTRELLALSFALGVTLYRDKVYNMDRVKENYEDYQIVHENDLVLSPNDIIKGSAYVSKYHGCISPMYLVFSARDTQTRYLPYLSYLLRTREAGRKFFYIARGLIGDILDNGKYVTRRMSVSKQDLLSFKVLLPPITEQQRIVNFLDKKCAEIDEMILLQEKIIEELKAYKQSIITEAVTKGLNPNVPMKDSGIEWIGEIPEHWEICKIKNGLTINPIQNHNLKADTEVSYMPMECLRNGVIEKRIALYGNLPSLTEFSEGDIVMAKVTPCFENGNIAIASDLVNEVGFGTSEIFVFRCHKSTLPKFAFYYLQSPYIKSRGVSSMTGTGGLKRINPHFFCDSVLLLPSLTEQEEIADYLDKKRYEIDDLITIKQSKIDSLKEYKKSIIYEYVTGKKEVTE